MDKYSALKYSSYIKRIIILVCLPFFYIAVYLLTKEDNAKISLLHIILPLIIAFVLIVLMHIARKITLGSLFAIDVNVQTLYELDKRKDTPKNREHNLKLHSNVDFYGGMFRETIDECQECIEISKNERTKFNARHKMILSYFFLSEFSKALELIEVQRKSSEKKNSEILSPFYDYIELYCNGEYDKAVNIINSFLDKDENKILNNYKIVALFMKKSVLDLLNDTESARKCADEIRLIDSRHLTCFYI